MENFEMTSVMWWVLIVVGALILLIIVYKRFFSNVKAREIAIKERRFWGTRNPPGRVVATEGEVGMQADVLKAGLHFILFPLERIVKTVPLIEIGADELGIIEAIDGEPMPPGHIF